MLLTGIVIAIVALGYWSAWIIHKRTYKDDLPFYIGCISTFFAGCVVLGMIPSLIITHLGAPVEFEKLQYERESIVYRLEQASSDESITVNGGIYRDVAEFNSKIMEYKYWKNNFWISDFFPVDIELIEEIPLPAGS